MILDYCFSIDLFSGIFINKFNIEIKSIQKIELTNEIIISFNLFQLMSPGYWNLNKSFKLKNFNKKKFIENFGIIRLNKINIIPDNIIIQLSYNPIENKTKYCKLCNNNVLDNKGIIYNDKTIYCSSNHMKSYENLFNTRFNPESSTDSFDKLNILIIDSHYKKEGEDQFLQYILNDKDTNFFRSNLFKDSEFDKRNPFLCFTNKDKKVSLNLIDGKSTLSWNLPYETPLFRYLGYLEFSFFCFIFPVNFIENNEQIDQRFKLNWIIQQSIIEYQNDIDYSKIIERYGLINPYSLIIGLYFLYNLQRLILINGTSDIKYLKTIFGDENTCISIIQKIRDLFIFIFYMNKNLILKELDIYLNSLGELKEFKNYKRYYNDESIINNETLFINEDDLIPLDILLSFSLLSDQKIYDKIKSLIFELWIIILAQVKPDFYKHDLILDPTIPDIPFIPKNHYIDNNYFYKSFYYFKNNNLSDFLFNNYKLSLIKHGILFDKQDIIKEVSMINKFNNLLSYQNIINICKIKNINRCIIFCNNIKEISNFEDLFKKNNNLYPLNQKLIFLPWNHMLKSVTSVNESIPIKYINFLKKLEELFYKYLILEVVDDFLMISEFKEEEKEEEEEKGGKEIQKLQSYINLIEYYKQFILDNKDDNDMIIYNDILKIGLYIYFLLKTISPTFNIKLSSFNKYKHSYSNQFINFKNFIFSLFDYKEDRFDFLIISRNPGNHFERQIIHNTMTTTQRYIDSFINSIISSTEIQKKKFS